MTHPKNLSAYADCEDYFERALKAPRGIAITLDSAREAIRIRLKMNVYRKMLRERNRDIYPEGHPDHNRSPYDELRLAISADRPTIIRAEKYSPAEAKVEEL